MKEENNTGGSKKRLTRNVETFYVSKPKIIVLEVGETNPPDGNKERKRAKKEKKNCRKNPEA